VIERSATGPQTNVNVNPAAPAAEVQPGVWTATRVVTLFFTVLEVLLLVRFALKLLGANPSQPLVAGLYGVTEPLVRPFQGIFPEPAGPPAFDIAALLAILFFFLIAALIVALVRAITGERRLA
jgi:uncharacterized protein YggT (Ycf19 family)